MTRSKCAGRSAGLIFFGPGGHLRMDVVQPVEGDEDHRRDQVGAVVHRDVRLELQGGDDVLVVGVGVLAVDGVDVRCRNP